MNVLGVCFDSKLTWSMHVANSINKANKALHAIRLIKKYFTHFEILQLLVISKGVLSVLGNERSRKKKKTSRALLLFSIMSVCNFIAVID